MPQHLVASETANGTGSPAVAGTVYVSSIASGCLLAAVVVALEAALLLERSRLLLYAELG